MAMIRDDDLIQVMDAATERYHGSADLLRGALGALVMGRLLGWKPLYLIQNRSTLDRYEIILSVKFREVLPEVGRFADKSLAWRVVLAGQHFWDVVKNRVPGRTAEVV